MFMDAVTDFDATGYVLYDRWKACWLPVGAVFAGVHALPDRAGVMLSSTIG
jgi:hypothetical protein